MAGESAQEQYDRYRERRHAALREPRRAQELGLVLVVMAVVAGVAAHVALGAWWLGVVLVAAIGAGKLAPTQREVAWRRGAEGERVVGNSLDRLRTSGARTLHDRRMPRSRANIDHIVVAPSGVVVVDAKHYRGKLEVRRGGCELWVAGRNRTTLLDGVERQAGAVRGILAEHGLGAPVRAALCFVGVEWPLLAAPRQAADVALLSPDRCARLVEGPSVLTAADVHRITEVLGRALPPAAGAARPAAAPRTPPRLSGGQRRTPAVPTAAPGASPVTCRCGEPMMKRTRRSDGAAFYGCSAFPRCRQTRAWPA